MVPSRMLRRAGLVVATVAVVLALLPFSTSFTLRTHIDIAYPTTSVSCGPPIVEATRTPPKGGWFGYAPLTSVPPTAAHVGCHAPAERRLWLSAGGLLLASLLAFLSLRRDGRRRYGSGGWSWRPHLRPS